MGTHSAPKPLNSRLRLATHIARSIAVAAFETSPSVCGAITGIIIALPFLVYFLA